MQTIPASCKCGSPLRVFTQRECLSCGRLSLYDVENVDGFIADAIKDGKARLNPRQREEMMAEGRQIMVRLAQQYQPGKGGREINGSRFSGFAAKYLRLKLSDAYARVCEHDDPDGDPAQRPALSLEVVLVETPARTESYDGYVEGWEAEIDRSAALEKQYLRLVMDGATEREAAQILHLEPSEVRQLAAILRLRLEDDQAKSAESAVLETGG